MTSPGPPPQYISFCEKKVKRPEGTYTLFWIQDTANHDTLAIVGKGAKYRTPPQCKTFPAYSATSKNEVLGWLASIGAERQITDKAAKVPQLSEEDWLKLQAKPRKAAAKPSAASKPKQPPSKPQQQQQQQAPQQQRVAASPLPATPKVHPTSAAAANKTGGTLQPTSQKASGRPRKKAKTREPCEYCSKTTHDSEECPIKLAAEEGSEADISEDDQPHDQPHGQPHAQPCEPMDVDTAAAEPAPSSDMEAGNEEEAELAPSVALAPLRHDAVIRRDTGREVSFSPEVQDAYQHNPELLNWVSGSLNQEVLDMLTQWSTELTGIVSPSPPKQMYTDNDGQPLRWLETGKAIQILRQLQSKQINLRMLELSQISMPVAMLRNNADQEVQMLARALAKKWRELAVAALDCATKALESR